MAVPAVTPAVLLTWPESELAALAGIRRRLLALEAGRTGAYGANMVDPWQEDIEACGAELAVAKVLGQYWTAWARTPEEVTADVGVDVQVKRIREEHHSLMVHRPDRPDHRFFLVYGKIPTFHIVGWCYGHEAKQEQYWGDPHRTGRPAFWVPRGHLRPYEVCAEYVANGAVPTPRVMSLFEEGLI